MGAHLPSEKKMMKDMKLTKAQMKKLEDHAKMHTMKHMRSMKKDMKKGMTFSQAHSAAMKKVGNGKK
jgi:hypothetical protein